MKPYTTPPPRTEAYAQAARLALYATAVLLVVLKLFTPIPFPAAGVIALVLFIAVFGLRLRMTPYE